MTSQSHKAAQDSGSEDYEVGYKKPPRNTQFRKGKSGNPAGRPKRAVNVQASLNKMLSEPIRVTVDRRARKMSIFDASLLNLRTKVLNGDLKALGVLLRVMTTAGMIKAPAESESDVVMSREDELMLGQAFATLSIGDSSKETGHE